MITRADMRPKRDHFVLDAESMEEVGGDSSFTECRFKRGLDICIDLTHRHYQCFDSKKVRRWVNLRLRQKPVFCTN